MANSVQNDHVGDGMPKTPTVRTSPHDSADDLSNNNDVVGRPTALSDRALSVKRVLNEVRVMDIVKMTISHSPLFAAANQEALFCSSIWEEVNKKLVLTRAATVEKDTNKCALMYIKEYAKIDQHTARMYTHGSVSCINTSISDVRRHLSLLLQIITMEYVDAFGRLIKYSTLGQAFSTKELTERAFAHVFASTTDDLFPRHKVRCNVYYIIGFLRDKAEKHSKRLSQGSGRQACMSYFSRY